MQTLHSIACKKPSRLSGKDGLFCSWDLVSADVVLRIITALDDLVGYSRCSWMWLIDSCEQYTRTRLEPGLWLDATCNGHGKGFVRQSFVEAMETGCSTSRYSNWQYHESDFVWPDEAEGLSVQASTYSRPFRLRISISAAAEIKPVPEKSKVRSKHTGQC